MTEEMSTHNVMSVELAIKRELEYRRKMEALQFQLPKGDAVSSQEPPLSALGIKRKAPASDVQCFPPPHLRPSCSNQPFENHPVRLLCQACEETFSSVFCLKKHCEGQKHKAKLIWMKMNNVSNPLWCGLCQVSCSSGHTLEQHLIGRRHAASLQAKKDAKTVRKEIAEVENIKWDKMEWK